MPRLLSRFIKRSRSSDLPESGTPIQLPDLKRVWIVAGVAGVLFWLAGLILWGQGSLDQRVLFAFDPSRLAHTPLVSASQWLTGNGMPVITALYVLYLLASSRLPSLDAPKTLYLYVLFSFGLSGIAGDLMKMVLDRPRPMATFAGEILALSSAGSQAIPSGHTTKALALALPFLFLVSARSVQHKILKAVFLSVALGVAFSRIVLGAHYLSDVLAGFGMALIGLPFSMVLAHEILRRTDEQHLPGMARVWAAILVGLTVLFTFL